MSAELCLAALRTDFCLRTGDDFVWACRQNKTYAIFSIRFYSSWNVERGQIDVFHPISELTFDVVMSVEDGADDHIVRELFAETVVVDEDSRR